ncbi:uncharacterized protein LOC127000375 [Eriocheir sinensis]|uniref:uncharacterized protein LOC127000375 n=1 Tax=Eriocheir sinensis TaxID=95602 RepID=UPI0021CA0D1A|nr:uncharacterized protein LOC127000375 [Eriocheir sinensis]
MHPSSLLVVLAALGGASACKYYCKVPNGNTYICCDDGNPFLDTADDEPAPGYDSAEVDDEVFPSEYPPAANGCLYYCSYDGAVYCCADNSVPIPENQNQHEGLCPEEEEQVCKTQGIFLVTKKSKTGRTSGALLLAEGDVKEKPSCASDGYCGEEERCCPSKCAQRHICLKSLPEEDDEE